MTNKVGEHMAILREMNDLYNRKNRDYGDSFHETFMEEGFAMARIRLSDKLNRFKRLTRGAYEAKITDESMRDTLIDLANYAVMTIMEIDATTAQHKEADNRELAYKATLGVMRDGD